VRKPEQRRHAAEALVFCLTLCRGWGRNRINRVMSRPDFDAVRAWQALRLGAVHDLAPIFDAEMHALPLDELPARVVEAEHLVASARQQNLRILLPGDSAYPAEWQSLLRGDAPPFVLARGNPDLANWPLRGGVAGTRQPTGIGRRVARRCGQVLAELQAVTVSGGAAGVDTEAHDAALKSGGGTVIIVPADILTQRATWLRAAAAGRALLLSECLPGAAWTTPAAVQRNRLIAALSQAVWIVEPRKEGGSIRTARVAAALGRPVACYGPPPSLSPAPPWEIIPHPDAVTSESVFRLLTRPPRHAQGELFPTPET